MRVPLFFHNVCESDEQAISVGLLSSPGCVTEDRSREGEQ